MAAFAGGYTAQAVIDAAAVRVARQALHAAPKPPPPKPRRTKAAEKRELMEQARRAGWTGKSYRSAKKFERKLERES